MGIITERGENSAGVHPWSNKKGKAMYIRLASAVQRQLSYIRILVMRMRGIQVGRECRVAGKAKIQRAKGSQITLGDAVTLISTNRKNPLVQHEVRIETLTPSAEIRLDDHVCANGCQLVSCKGIHVGENTYIEANAIICDGNEAQRAGGGYWEPHGSEICIGKNCLIGHGCIIHGGITIGDGCEVEPGSVVTQDIPDGSRAYGNPAKIEPLATDKQ